MTSTSLLTKQKRNYGLETKRFRKRHAERQLSCWYPDDLIIDVKRNIRSQRTLITSSWATTSFRAPRASNKPCANPLGKRGSKCEGDVQKCRGLLKRHASHWPRGFSGQDWVYQKGMVKRGKRTSSRSVSQTVCPSSPTGRALSTPLTFVELTPDALRCATTWRCSLRRINLCLSPTISEHPPHLASQSWHPTLRPR